MENTTDFPLTLLGRIIWEDRYALKDQAGKPIESNIFETFRRTAKAQASKESKSKMWEDLFYSILATKKFCPAGRILAHSGTHYSQLLNCFVLPFRDDSLEEIMHTASDMAIVQKFGGGCIGGESVVITNKGPISIKKIVEDKDTDLKVLSYDEKTGKMEYCAILDRHTTPLSGDRVYEISFGAKSKAKMRASDWHPFFAFDGDHVVQVRADELKSGMVIIGSTNFSVGYDDWGWLLGYVAGDGAVSQNGLAEYTRIRISDDKESCISRASEIMNVEYHLSKNPIYKVDVWLCEAYAGMAAKIKEEFGGHQVCLTKHVPKSMWESSPERQLSFIVGYLDADGWFNKEKERFEAFSVSKTLIYEVAALAGSIGVRSTIRFRTSRKNSELDGWEIRFSKSRTFYEAVTSISAKYKITETGWACGSVPLSSEWKEKLETAGVSVNTREAWRGRVTIAGSDSSLVNWLQKGRTTRETAATILKTCGQDLIAKSVLSSQVIKDVRPTGVSETLYDLTVDKNQTYVASDPTTGAFVIVHNTGFNYSRLRPTGSYIKGVNGRSCGMIGFIGMMSTISEVIEQGGCFVGDTQVATIGGPKKIRDLKKGDLVYSMKEGHFVLKSCAVDAWLTIRGARVFKISTKTGLNFFATENHPFMDRYQSGYTKVSDLTVGFLLMPFVGGAEIGVEDSVLSVEYSHEEDVYNVEVEDTHNFVVCDSFNRGVVVSNSRRGANLGLLEVGHPDIWEFISYKTDHNWDRLLEFMDVKDKRRWSAFKFENFYKWQMYNVSVGVNDEFLTAVKEDSDWALVWDGVEWPLTRVEYRRKIDDKWDTQMFQVTADCDATAIWKVKKLVPFPAAVDQFNILEKRRPKAREIWNRICYNAWADGCPGLLNMSTIRRMHNMEWIHPVLATNPCLDGNTLVAVADGRNAVTIRQLADEGKDVPVYCRKPDGGLTVRMMRNPRITGYGQNMVKVTVDGGHSVRVTENHKFTLSNGSEVMARDLQPGVSLSVLNRVIAPFEKILRHSNSKSQKYSWLGVTGRGSWNLEHRLIYNFYNPGELKFTDTVHHEDRNGLNNVVGNLVKMTKQAHDQLHSVDKIGDKNPMRRAQTEWTAEEWAEYSENMSKAVSGDKNGRFLEISNEDLLDKAVELTKSFGRPLSTHDWEYYALEHGYPSQFSRYRSEVFGGITGFLEAAAVEAGVGGAHLRHANLREYRRYLSLKETSDLDLTFDFDDGVIKVRKKCEGCGKEIIVGWEKRELSYCSRNCHADHYILSKEGRESLVESFATKREEKRRVLINTYNDLHGCLGRPPMRKEYEASCKERRIPFRLPTDYDLRTRGDRFKGAFKGWGDLVQSASDFNHRVVSVEPDGVDTVYNGTVDQYHNFYFGHFQEDRDGDTKYVYLNGPQCGEQPLPANSCCLLASIVLSSFVNDDGSFNFESFRETIPIAVRFMDDVIDNCEFPLNEMKEMELSERRIGLGTMGVHDMLMKMRLGYDTIEGRAAVESILIVLRDVAYRSSIVIAKEKGAFPLFDKEKYLASGFVKTLPQDIRDDIAKYGIRNACVLSQAPTGTIGTMLNESTGCEPWFDLVMQRNTRLGSYEDGCETFLKWHQKNPGKETPSYFKTAQDIKPEDHLAMMILFSKYNDSATSKTLNLPASSTVEDVSKLFLSAMSSGVKGVTVFRYGCKDGVLVHKPTSEKAQDVAREALKAVKLPEIEEDDVPPVSEIDDTDDTRQNPIKRGYRTLGATTRVNMQTHNMYVTVNRNKDGDLVEVFATVGESKNPKVHHTSGIEDSWAEGLGKIVSLALRAGVEPKSIIRNLKNIPSDKPVFTTVGDSDHSEHVPSPPHAVARVMEEELKYEYGSNTDVDRKKQEEVSHDGERCRNCGSTNLWWRSPTCYECRDCPTSGCLS